MASTKAMPPSHEPEKSQTGVRVDIHEASSTDHVCDEKHKDGNCEHVQWETGFRKRFPWIGAMALLIMLICIAMDGVILGTSHLKFAEEWPAHQRWEFISADWRTKSQIAPHVLLAIANTVTNVALAIAIGHGVAIAWWRRVLRGSTIEDLHRSWGFASSMLELLTAGKRFNYIALAALMAKIALVDNVLLQQAISTAPGYYEQRNMTLRLPMARTLPRNYAAIEDDDGESTGTVAVPAAFSWDLYYLLDNPLKIDPNEIYPPSRVYSADNTTDEEHEYDTGCAGLCHGKFQGFGFHWDCSPINTTANYSVTPEAAKQNSAKQFFAAQQAIYSAIGENSTEANLAVANAEYDRLASTDLRRNLVFAVETIYIARGESIDNAFFTGAVPSQFANRSLEVPAIGIQMQWSSYVGDQDLSSTTCQGTTSSRMCILQPAVIDYVLDITNITPDENAAKPTQLDTTAENGIALGVMDPDSPLAAPGYAEFYNETEGLRGLTFQGQFNGYTANLTAYRPKDPNQDGSNIKSIAEWLRQSFSAGVMLEYLTSKSYNGYLPNFNAVGSSSVFGMSWMEYDPSERCTLRTVDPLGHIVDRLNSLMVRSSMRAATDYKASFAKGESEGPVIQTMIQEQRNLPQLKPSVYYATVWRYGAAVMCIVFFCILCVLPSYWGFWQLGRKVTLGPIEVAGAFQAPIMNHPSVATHGEVDGLIKEIGDRRVRYGLVEGQQRLAVATPAEVTRPGR